MPATLRAATRPPPHRLAIPLLRFPPTPARGRPAAGLAAIPRLRPHGRKPAVAALQQTPPRPRPTRPTTALRCTKIYSIVRRAHGRGLYLPGGSSLGGELLSLLRGVVPQPPMLARLRPETLSDFHRRLHRRAVRDRPFRSAAWTTPSPPKWTSLKPAATLHLDETRRATVCKIGGRVADWWKPAFEVGPVAQPLVRRQTSPLRVGSRIRTRHPFLRCCHRTSRLRDALVDGFLAHRMVVRRVDVSAICDPAHYEAHSPAIVCGRNSSVSARST